MLKKELKEEFKEFEKENYFTVVFGEDIVTEKIFFKIYKNNLAIEEQFKLITKMKKMEIDKNENIKVIILENIENRMNRHFNGTLKTYFEKVEYDYKKGSGLNVS